MPYGMAKKDIEGGETNKETEGMKFKPGRVCMLSCVQLFETPCTVACQAPLSMGFSRQEYWSGLPFPPPGIPTRDRTHVFCVSCTGRRVLYH